MEKLFVFKDKAQEHLYNGVKILSKAVKPTLGPQGKKVLYNKNSLAVVTKKGLEITQQMILENSFENMGVKLLKEAAQNTQDEVGDGTTTSIVLAEAMIDEGIKLLLDNIDPNKIKRGMDAAVKDLLNNLLNQAKPIQSKEDLFHIATIGANNDSSVGEVLSRALESVGKEGLVTFGSSKTNETSLEIVKGMEFSGGYLSPYFVTNPTNMTVQFKDPYILIIDQKIEKGETLVPILEKLSKIISEPLFIIATELKEEALSTLALNKIKQGLSIAAVNAPEFGDHQKEMLEDIATYTGATVIKELSNNLFLEDGLKVLGKAKSITITKENTLVVGGKVSKKSIEKRKDFIKEQMTQCKKSALKHLEERLEKLSGIIARVNIGAVTQTELQEKKVLFSNGLKAAKIAMKKGIVQGGGVALIRAAEALDVLVLDPEDQYGANLIKHACKAPLLTIANNAGADGENVVDKVLKQEEFYGYNAVGGQFTDLFKDRVVDPVVVVQSALKNAASIASMLLTCILMVTENLEK